MRSISATELIKTRPGFGQTIRPAKGSVLASPILASYDPDPDYFFHWMRDSAIVIDALRRLIVAGTVGREGLDHFKDFLAFSLSLCDLNGQKFLSEAGDFRRNVEPFFLQYVRPEAELAKIIGDHALAEPRFNPDGTLDIIKWSRPQHDGPALRALTAMRFCSLELDAATRAAARALITRDVAFCIQHWRDPSYDIWEEELGRHYYTRLVQYAALADGARWLEDEGESGISRACRAASEEIERSLDQHWSDSSGYYRSRLAPAIEESSKDLDFATILGVIHADRPEGPHSVLDPKALATLAKLESLFETTYPINRLEPARRAPAMGRYAGDRYYSGGAYYFSTLGAAQFYFSLSAAIATGASIGSNPDDQEFLHQLGFHVMKDSAAATESSAPNRRAELGEALFHRGDLFMATVEAYAPTSGELAEQFDQATGAPASAKDLAWSHAAFITAFASRAAALRAKKSGPLAVGALR
ncbi:glycoside hydrolase family 15 protein [Methylocapsa acidiphila]|uniref:glycoside hydrolase family 15 protein n=1 Tax=Methylocapsa acidiphila TaxID=133552 RepID=UPI0018DE1CC8|nr:glycoside hydrolase family 15 protein [Methylocapsa acidiphila]